MDGVLASAVVLCALIVPCVVLGGFVLTNNLVDCVLDIAVLSCMAFVGVDFCAKGV